MTTLPTITRRQNDNSDVVGKNGSTLSAENNQRQQNFISSEVVKK